MTRLLLAGLVGALVGAVACWFGKGLLLEWSKGS